jgi:DNA-3-methyladenine glycosylase
VDTVELARYLIGKVVVHDIDCGRLSGRIVETEAYPVGDAAGHAFHGKTRRNRSLFLERGHAYVYFTYGSSFLLNVTSEAPGVGGGVLLRAVEPLEGIDELISAKTDWTCALPARFGWRQPRKGLARSAKACASASPAM